MKKTIEFRTVDELLDKARLLSKVYETIHELNDRHLKTLGIPYIYVQDNHMIIDTRNIPTGLTFKDCTHPSTKLLLETFHSALNVKEIE
jgi:hypothetical protein